jgi:hypothetical protein
MATAIVVDMTRSRDARGIKVYRRGSEQTHEYRRGWLFRSGVM